MDEPLILLAAAADRLPPLTDTAGRPYEPADMPCCWSSGMFDPDAPREDRRRACSSCLGCPARRPCRQRAGILGDLASGVWAGRDRGDRVEHPTRPAAMDDAQLAGWARDAGVRR